MVPPECYWGGGGIILLVALYWWAKSNGRDGDKRFPLWVRLNRTGIYMMTIFIHLLREKKFCQRSFSIAWVRTIKFEEYIEYNEVLDIIDVTCANICNSICWYLKNKKLSYHNITVYNVYLVSSNTNKCLS